MERAAESGSSVCGADLAILEVALRAKFGAGFEGLDARFELLVLGPEALLFQEGDLGQEVYVVLNGRLRAFRRTPKGVEILNEIGRGETVGELAFLLNTPRSASVVAVRETRVARFTRAAFEALLAEKPQLATAVMRLAIERFRNQERIRSAIWRPVVIAVVKASPRIDILGFANRLASVRSKFGGPADVVTIGDIPCAGGAEADLYARNGPAAEFLNHRAAVSEALFLVIDAGPSKYAQHCLQIADEILLVASDLDAPQKSSIEARIIEGDKDLPRASKTLVLLHPPCCAHPRATDDWLARRKVQRHFHVREDADRDWSRLARILAGQAVGLVLSGGGARGLAQIGVLQAFYAAGVNPDYVGGTSMGAIISALDAIEIRGEALVEAGRSAFKHKLTNDYNVMPLMSLVKGLKVQHAVRSLINRAVGVADLCSEDTWKAHFCIGSNYTTASEVVLRRGLLWRNLVASAAIPGIFPPQIIDNGLIFDGATFNNFPVDVMERQGAAYIIGVDMLVQNDDTIDLDRLPNAASLLMDRWKRRAARKYRLPLLHETLFRATLLGSQAKQRAMRSRLDFHVTPRIEGVGWFDWSRYDETVRQGYESTMRQIEKLDSEQLKPMQAT